MYTFFFAKCTCDVCECDSAVEGPGFFLLCLITSACMVTVTICWVMRTIEEVREEHRRVAVGRSSQKTDAN